MSFSFIGGAVGVAVPVTLLAIARAAGTDFQRRRTQFVNIHRHEPRRSVDLDARDPETLVSE